MAKTRSEKKRWKYKSVSDLSDLRREWSGDTGSTNQNDAGLRIINHPVVSEFLIRFPSEAESIDLFIKSFMAGTEDAQPGQDEEQADQVIESLSKKIRAYTETFETIKPVADEVMPLWGLHTGEPERSWFPELEKYSFLLEKSGELKELLEILGKSNKQDKKRMAEDFDVFKGDSTSVFNHAQKSEVVGVHESGDIESLTSPEIGLLSEVHLESVFDKKFAEKKLLTYQFFAESEEDSVTTKRRRLRSEKGPIVLGLDTSDSMRGQPEKYARAICLQVLKMAIRERRKVLLILFSVGSREMEVVPLEQTLPTLMNFLRYSLRGGTSIRAVFERTVERMKEKDYQGADLLLVTDGELEAFQPTQVDQLESLRKRGNRFYSFIVGDSPVKSFTDQMDHFWTLRDFSKWNETLRNTYNKIQLVRKKEQ